MQKMHQHPLEKSFWTKKIWANLVRFVRNLGKIKAKFGQI